MSPSSQSWKKWDVSKNNKIKIYNNNVSFSCLKWRFLSSGNLSWWCENTGLIQCMGTVASNISRKIWAVCSSLSICLCYQNFSWLQWTLHLWIVSGSDNFQDLSHSGTGSHILCEGCLVPVVQRTEVHPGGSKVQFSAFSDLWRYFLELDIFFSSLGPQVWLSLRRRQCRENEKVSHLILI